MFSNTQEIEPSRKRCRVTLYTHLGPVLKINSMKVLTASVVVIGNGISYLAVCLRSLSLDEVENLYSCLTVYRMSREKSKTIKLGRLLGPTALIEVTTIFPCRGMVRKESEGKLKLDHRPSSTSTLMSLLVGYSVANITRKANCLYNTKSLRLPELNNRGTRLNMSFILAKSSLDNGIFCKEEILLALYHYSELTDSLYIGVLVQKAIAANQYHLCL
ncbi:hypothetical protein J6590_044231 [Homalodisca vitripennis]|nr:hypothetical protein J6590_044231 [Homalodisca vitripennis]